MAYTIDYRRSARWDEKREVGLLWRCARTATSARRPRRSASAAGQQHSISASPPLPTSPFTRWWPQSPRPACLRESVF